MYLKAIDAAALPNCAVVVGLPGGGTVAGPSAVDAAQTIKTLLPVSSAGAGSFHDWFLCDDSATLGEALMRAATRVRNALVASDPASRAENTDLSDAARKEGIPIESQPMVAGPGAVQP